MRWVGVRLGGMVPGVFTMFLCVLPPFRSRLLVIMVVAGFTPLGGGLMRMRVLLVYFYALSMKTISLCPSIQSSW